MAIFFDWGLFFNFAELSPAPTPALAETELSFSFDLSNNPPTHPPRKVTGKLSRAKEAKQKLSVYIRRTQ